MKARYFDVRFAARGTHQRVSAPALRVWARDAREAKDKGNALVLRDGRSRDLDLAWTAAQ